MTQLLRHITTQKQFEHNLPGFTEVYKKAFAGPPYFENFTDQEVAEIMRELVFGNSGFCSVLVYSDKIIGLSGGFRVSIDEKISALMRERGFRDIESYFYIAELAVLENFRKKGFGNLLVEDMLKAVQEKRTFKNIIVRTQAEGSNALNIFKSQGLLVQPDLTQNVQTYAGDNGNREQITQKRIFLIKSI